MSVYDVAMRPATTRTLLAPAERRQQLLQAATWVFARKGYRRASVSDIIARAGVARGTFYLHFDSKEKVFLAIVEDFHRRIAKALGEAGASGAAADAPQALLKASFRRWLELFAENRDAATVVLKEASTIDARFEKGFADLRRSAVQHFAARYRRFQELGFVRASISPELMAHLLLGMFDEILQRVRVEAFRRRSRRPRRPACRFRMERRSTRLKGVRFRPPIALAVPAFMSIAFVPPAHAQSDFGELKLGPGDQIYVTPPSGAEVSGRLISLTPTLLEIDGHQFKPEPGLTIDRRGDSLLNGALIGVPIGVLAGVTIGAEACLDSEKWKCAVGGAVTYAALGALIDWLHVRPDPHLHRHEWHRVKFSF